MTDINLTLRNILQSKDSDRFAVIKNLIQFNNVDINYRNDDFDDDTYGYTPLMYCLENDTLNMNDDTLQIAKFLIENGANVNDVTDEDEHAAVTPLWLATSNGNFNVVQLLVENGAKDNNEKGLLSNCLCYDYGYNNSHRFEIFKYLIEHGFKYNKVDKYYRREDGLIDEKLFFNVGNLNLNDHAYEVIKNIFGVSRFNQYLIDNNVIESENE